MLAELAAEPFDSDRHLFEPKWDGYRCLAFIRPGETVLQSRNLRLITAEFAPVSRLHEVVETRDAVLDGEITAWEGGRPSFSALQASRGTILYVVFDILRWEGRELLSCPLEERRRLLAACVPEEAGAPVLLSPVVPGRGKELFAAAARLGLEGTVGKELSSPYRPGERSRCWLKAKVRHTADCVILGYRLAPGGGLGSLVLAVPKEHGWEVVGHVGTGWDERTGEQIRRRLCPATPPVQVPPEFRRNVTWVLPEVVCTVNYQEITPEGKLRHPSFVGLRPDLEPHEAGLEGRKGVAGGSRPSEDDAHCAGRRERVAPLQPG